MGKGKWPVWRRQVDKGGKDIEEGGNESNQNALHRL